MSHPAQLWSCGTSRPSKRELSQRSLVDWGLGRAHGILNRLGGELVAVCRAWDAEVVLRARGGGLHVSGLARVVIRNLVLRRLLRVGREREGDSNGRFSFGNYTR